MSGTWLGGPNFHKAKRYGKNKENGGPAGRNKTRDYYSGNRMGGRSKKHGKPASFGRKST